ncbi:uncharacterized protein C2845_PM17G01250 [Panicum miliaceum]|uniref:DUF4220 domain-containing protein n=1 Tax=Panicum miliaceum TaxID=4540 RepID=A0A3L6Q2B3_PANMI|nr:uncharacterized protein C2845_PM17G01250 [Panicum miliaceum]
MLGLQYFEQMLEQLWGDNSTGDAIELHADVKTSISDYLRRNQLHRVSLSDRRCLGVTYELDPEEEAATADDYMRHLLTWHIATCYCEARCTDSERATAEKNHRVATALSKYLAHLVVSVPRLLPGRYVDYKHVYDQVSKKAGEVLHGVEDNLGSMERAVQIGFLGHVKYRSCEIRRIIMENSARLRSLMRATVDEENRSYQIHDMMRFIGINEEASREKISCEQGIKRSTWAVWGRWAEEWERGQEREIHLWQLLKDDLGTIMENRSGAMGMEEGREVLLQAKREVESAAMERERGTMKEGWLTVMDWLSSAGATFMLLKEKLGALQRECERIMEALGRAIDKLEEKEKELQAERGTHQYNDVLGNPVLGSRIFYSGMYLGGRLQLLPAPERWKRLADLWVTALVYAAPSDDVEEHMQHLAQGGEFITHVWAMLYHRGILRPEEAAGRYY